MLVLLNTMSQEPWGKITNHSNLVYTSIMEPETVYSQTPVAPPAEATPPATTLDPHPAPLASKKPLKLLYIFGGIAIALLSLAGLILLLGTRNNGGSVGSNSTTEEVAQIVSTWPKYSNTQYFYELSVPPKWEEVKTSPLHPEVSLFNALDTASLEVRAEKNLLSLDEYLSLHDQANQSSVKATKTNQVKVGDYDGIERAESWSQVALQGYTTYVKVSDMLYTFSLIPAGDRSAITNESILRDYRALLASFRLTDTSQLGLDLKEYTSEKLATLNIPAFSLKYPQTWVVSEQYVGSDTFIASIYRNNYEIRITQAPVGGAVCLFNDSPDFQGSSGDLRNKQFTEFETSDGTLMRRYFNANEGDKSTLYFCRKERDTPYFSTPTDVGGIVYYVPAKYDEDIVKEMDAIVKSITPILASPSASPTP